MGRARARCNGWSSPPAAGPTSRRSGLAAAGVKLTENGLIEVDGAMGTSVEGIYVIGDLTPGPALTHKASEEAVIAAEDAAGMQTYPIEYDDIPPRHLLHAQRGRLPADRGPGPRAGLRGGGRQGS